MNQPTMRMIQRRKELLGRRGLKKQALIMTYHKVIEKKVSIGSEKDITTNTTYTRKPYITQNYQMLNGLYTNWIGGKAVVM